MGYEGWHFENCYGSMRKLELLNVANNDRIILREECGEFFEY